MVIEVIFFTLVPNNLLPFAAIAHDHGPCEIVFFWIHPPVIPLDGHPGRLSLNEPLMNSMPEPLIELLRVQELDSVATRFPGFVCLASSRRLEASANVRLNDFDIWRFPEIGLPPNHPF